MQPGQTVKARNRKFGSWAQGDMAQYAGVVDGRYTVDYHGSKIRYRSESEVEKEWESARGWRGGDELIYRGPATQHVRPGDFGTYQGEHNQMHMVRVAGSGYIDSHSVQAEYHGKGVSSVWEWCSPRAMPPHQQQQPWGQGQIANVTIMDEAPPKPTLDIGQQLLVNFNVTFFDHLNSKFGAYEGKDGERLVVRLEEGGVARYANETALLNDWQKPQSSKELCNYVGGRTVRKLTLEQYLAKEEDPAKLEQAENFVALSEQEVVFTESAKGIIRMCASSVNDLVDQVDIERCLDLCNHEPVVAYPFCKLADGTKVFSYPTGFIVGRGNKNGFGYTYDPKTVKAELTKMNISEAVQAKIQHHLESHKPPEQPDYDPYIRRGGFVEPDPVYAEEFFKALYGKK